MSGPGIDWGSSLPHIELLHPSSAQVAIASISQGRYLHDLLVAETVLLNVLYVHNKVMYGFSTVGLGRCDHWLYRDHCCSKLTPIITHTPLLSLTVW